MPIEMIEEFDQGTQIKVIGVGGGGGNAVDHMIAQAAGRRIHLRQHRCAGVELQQRAPADPARHDGPGAGAKPEVGRSAAVEAESASARRSKGAHMLFITAGMGGGTAPARRGDRAAWPGWASSRSAS